MNQKLFDSLHEELISYRDNFVRDALQKPFLRDLPVLLDDLSSREGQMNAVAESETGGAEQVRTSENLSNILHFVIEILHRLEVTEIEPKEIVDRTLHHPLAQPQRQKRQDRDDPGRV